MRVPGEGKHGEAVQPVQGRQGAGKGRGHVEEDRRAEQQEVAGQPVGQPGGQALRGHQLPDLCQVGGEQPRGREGERPGDGQVRPVVQRRGQPAHEQELRREAHVAPLLVQRPPQEVYRQQLGGDQDTVCALGCPSQGDVEGDGVHHLQEGARDQRVPPRELDGVQHGEEGAAREEKVVWLREGQKGLGCLAAQQGNHPLFQAGHQRHALGCHFSRRVSCSAYGRI